MRGSLTLYELSELYMRAMERIEAEAEANEGIIPDDWAEFLDAIDEPLEAKALSVGRWIKNLRCEADAIRAEEKILAARRHAAEARADRLQAWMTAALPPGKKIADATTVISWRRSTAVEIIGELPDEYYKIERTPKKAEIKDALNAGAELSGARIVEKQNLQIK